LHYHITSISTLKEEIGSAFQHFHLVQNFGLFFLDICKEIPLRLPLSKENKVGAMAEALKIVLYTGCKIENAESTSFEGILLEKNSSNSLKFVEELLQAPPSGQLVVHFAGVSSGIVVVPSEYGADDGGEENDDHAEEDAEEASVSTLPESAKEAFMCCLFGAQELPMPLTDPRCLLVTDDWILECLQKREIVSPLRFDVTHKIIDNLLCEYSKDRRASFLPRKLNLCDLTFTCGPKSRTPLLRKTVLNVVYCNDRFTKNNLVISFVPLEEWKPISFNLAAEALDFAKRLAVSARPGVTREKNRPRFCELDTFFL
jgi:hypothetical protein